VKENKIVIEIARDGRIVADADGFDGDACLRDLERLLDEASPGQDLVERKKDRPGPRVGVGQQLVRRRT
jgi:hypothetical protein